MLTKGLKTQNQDVWRAMKTMNKGCCGGPPQSHNIDKVEGECTNNWTWFKPPRERQLSSSSSPLEGGRFPHIFTSFTGSGALPVKGSGPQQGVYGSLLSCLSLKPAAAAGEREREKEREREFIVMPLFFILGGFIQRVFVSTVRLENKVLFHPKVDWALLQKNLELFLQFNFVSITGDALIRD